MALALACNEPSASLEQLSVKRWSRLKAILFDMEGPEEFLIGAALESFGYYPMRHLFSFPQLPNRVLNMTFPSHKTENCREVVVVVVR
jgi:hypothetical protein